MKRIIGLAAFVVLFINVGCTPVRSPAALDLVPASAVAVAEVRWQEALGHPILKQMAQLPPSLADVGRLDLAIDALDTVVVFSRSFSATEGETAILKGANLGSLFTVAASAGGWQQVPLAGMTAFFAPSPSNTAAAAIDDSLLVAGSRESVRAFGNSSRALGGFAAKAEFAEVGKAFTDPSPVRFMVSWPTEMVDRSRMTVAASAGLMKFAGYGFLGSVIERLGIGRAYVVRLTPEGSDVRVTVAGVMQDEDTAATVSGGLSLVKGLASLLPASARQAQPDPSSTLTVERTGAVVWVGLVVSASGLRQ